MKAFLYAFPVIFILFAAFFGYIAYSILVRKKPVLLNSRWLIGLIAIGYAPSAIISVVDIDFTGNIALLQSLFPVLVIALLAFYVYILKGYSIYGILDDDMRTFFFKALDTLNIKYTETMSKIHLVDLDTDINIAFQERMGTGMIKAKNGKKVNLKSIVTEFKKLLKENDVRTKKATAIFYAIFAVLMLGMTVVFTFVVNEI